MYITPINRAIFKGDLFLSNITPDFVSENYNKYKEIANKNDLDIVISKSHISKYIPPQKDLYLVAASKVIPNEIRPQSMTRHTLNEAKIIWTDKKIGTEELSKKLYETMVMAIQNLEIKFTELTGKNPNFLKVTK